MRWWAFVDEILHQLNFSLGLCHLREAMRTKQDLRSLSFFVLRALGVAGAATAWECAIGMSDEKPGMGILWLRPASVVCKPWCMHDAWKRGGTNHAPRWRCKSLTSSNVAPPQSSAKRHPKLVTESTNSSTISKRSYIIGEGRVRDERR